MMSASSPPDELDRRDWIAGLQKGLAIIEAFDVDHSRLNASDIARMTGLTRSSARRHLMTLTHLGYMASDGKNFWLMPKVLRLGTAYLHSARLPRVVQPFLQRLTGITQESAFVSVIDGNEIVFIARNGANRIMNTGFVLGARVPWVITSAGLAIMSTESPEYIEEFLRGYEMKAFTQFTITDKQVLLNHVRQARSDGYAMLEQQMELGVRGLAVPLKNHRAETLGAISISAQIGSESADQAIRRLLPPLQQIAANLRDVV